MTHVITLFGATGYTGRLTARALDRLGLPFRLAGRSPAKLAHLSKSLASCPPWLTADATQPNTLPSLCRDTRLLINCVGPFTDLGEPVLAQAALSGVHYLDTSNELAFVHHAHSYNIPARHSGAAIVPACGFEVALADCAAAILGQNAAAAAFDEASVVYDLHGKGSSLATRQSALRSLATSWLAYRGGRWVRAACVCRVEIAQYWPFLAAKRPPSPSTWPSKTSAPG